MSAALLVLLSASRARAEGPLELSWQAPVGCPQAADVRERVRAIAGDSLHGMSRLRAEGRVARIDARYRLTLKVYEGGAALDRTIDSPSCADLAGAAAVTLGLLLRNESGASRTPPTTTDPAGTGSASSAASSSDGARGASEPSAASRSETAREATSSGAEAEAETDAERDAGGAGGARRPRFLLRAPLGSLELGRLSGATWGGGAGVGLAYDHWRLTLDARIFGRRTLWSSEFSDVGVAVSPATLALAVCRGFDLSGFELSPCLAVELERAMLRGVGPNVVGRSETRTSLGFGAGTTAQFHLRDRLALVGGAMLFVESSRPRMALAGIDEVRQLGAVKLGVSLGAEWIF